MWLSVWFDGEFILIWPDLLSLFIFLILFKPFASGLCALIIGEWILANTLGEFLELDLELWRLDFFPLVLLELPIDFKDYLGENKFWLLFWVLVVFFVIKKKNYSSSVIVFCLGSLFSYYF